ncbi:MAG: uncharacterized protein KVP18_004438 [Porospora cf. gigantea A]|uniref:uncharacterized protein n=1 Tax=Porospora cf. gigantea A TaxID=2853593 RepID=UPI00355A33E7|nr:MAG: hypothetical protein KVP18_004438 [Porospora cf. gigantea A]
MKEITPNKEAVRSNPLPWDKRSVVKLADRVVALQPPAHSDGQPVPVAKRGLRWASPCCSVQLPAEPDDSDRPDAIVTSGN